MLSDCISHSWTFDVCGFKTLTIMVSKPAFLYWLKALGCCMVWFFSNTAFSKPNFSLRVIWFVVSYFLSQMKTMITLVFSTIC